MLLFLLACTTGPSLSDGRPGQPAGAAQRATEGDGDTDGLLASAAAATWTGAGINDQLGAAVAFVGDLNGDGFDDVAIGAHHDDVTIGRVAIGRVFIYHGSAAGPWASPATTLTGEGDQDRFGVALAPAGDVNGDGFADLLVGATDYFSDLAELAGYASVFHGSASGLVEATALTLSGAEEGAALGGALAGAGDVNGDGYDDVLIGASGMANGALAGAGQVTLHLGSPAGLDPTPSLTLSGSSAGEAFGAAVAGAGDVNGDGYGDVLIGADQHESGGYPECGRAAVYHGSAAGLDAGPTRTYTGVYGSRLGGAVAGAGDVNGDGYDDVLIGAPGQWAGAVPEVGEVTLYHGSAAGVGTATAWRLTGDEEGDNLGFALSPAGDLNADGYADVVVGADGSGAGGVPSAGAVLAFHGSASGLEPSPVRTLGGGAEGDHFGAAVSGGGDVDADGYDDVLVGAWAYSGLVNAGGQASLYLGYADDDGDGVLGDLDCDDHDAGVGAASAQAVDGDGDGYGGPDTTLACPGAPGTADDRLDCDDSRDDVSPAAAERCDGGPTDSAGGTDEDCDDLIDDDDPSLDPSSASPWHPDADGDGFGDPTAQRLACVALPGEVADDQDCDDGDPARHPGAPERCDAGDDDCDGEIDEGLDCDGAPDSGTPADGEGGGGGDGDGDGDGDGGADGGEGKGGCATAGLGAAGEEWPAAWAASALLAALTRRRSGRGPSLRG